MSATLKVRTERDEQTRTIVHRCVRGAHSRVASRRRRRRRNLSTAKDRSRPNDAGLGLWSAIDIRAVSRRATRTED